MRLPLFVLLVFVAPAAAEPQAVKVRVTGLFAPDRADDLRRLLRQWPELELASLDFDHAEAVFKLDPAQVFPGAKPTDLPARLDDRLRGGSHSTFGVKPATAVPRDQLRRIEIPVAGLDCKACCLAAYEAVARIDGVEQATASFQEGKVTALIDPKRTSREALETSLRERGVVVTKP
jgi:copper chaperone CopZ